MNNIWNEMRRMQEDMDSMFDSFFRENTRPILCNDSRSGQELASPGVKWPSADVYETESELCIDLDLPGVDKKDIKVNVNEDSIEVSAETKKDFEEKRKGSYRFERNYSGYYRAVPLPKSVDAAKADGEYKNGVLKIRVPKLKIEEKKRKLLEIK